MPKFGDIKATRRTSANSLEARKKIRAAKLAELRQRHDLKFVEPASHFTLAPMEERARIIEAEKKVPFLKEGKRVAVPLTDWNLMGLGALVLPFSFNGKDYVVRFHDRAFGNRHALIVTEIGPKGRVPGDFPYVIADYYDMAHFDLQGFEKSGLVIPLLKIARDHALSEAKIFRQLTTKGIPYVEGATRFGLYVKRMATAGYKKVGEREFLPEEREHFTVQDEQLRRQGVLDRYEPMQNVAIMQYSANPRRENNLELYYNIWGIDPETGKLKPFRFPRDKF